MGDVEDMLGELETSEDEESTEKALKKKKLKKGPRSQDEMELDLDSAWGSAARED